MSNTREFCAQEGNEHALVLPAVDIRDNLGILAIHILAAQKDLSKLSYSQILDELFEILDGLHSEYQRRV